MAVKTYVRTGAITWPMDDDEQTMYAEVDANPIGTTFQADLSEGDETWLIGNGVISPAPDTPVTLPADGTSAGDLPTADGSGDYLWQQPV